MLLGEMEEVLLGYICSTSGGHYIQLTHIIENY